MYHRWEIQLLGSTAFNFSVQYLGKSKPSTTDLFKQSIPLKRVFCCLTACAIKYSCTIQSVFLWATSVYLNCLRNLGCLSVNLILKEWLKKRRINSVPRDIRYQMGSNWSFINKYIGEILSLLASRWRCHWPDNPKSHSSFDTTWMDISGIIYTNTQTLTLTLWMTQKQISKNRKKRMNQKDGEHWLVIDALYSIYA